MSAWLRHHAYSATQALRRIAGTPLSSLLNVLVVGVALALPLGGYALLLNAAEVLPALTQRAEISIFLARGTERSEADKLSRELRTGEGVKEVRFVSKESALAGLKKSTGMAEVIGVLRENPLPDALVVVLARNDGDLAERIAQRARSSPSVAQAQVDSAWMRRLEAFSGLVRTALLVLGAVLAAALVAVTFNTIRLQILTLRDEIEVSRLVGATDAYIRRPFLYLGCLQGVLGGVAALAIVLGTFSLVDQDIATLARLYGSAFRLRLPGAPDCLALVALAALLGWAGAALSVSKYLRDIQPR